MNNNVSYDAENAEFNLVENMERIDAEVNNADIDRDTDKDTGKKLSTDTGDSKFLTDKKVIQSIERVQKTTVPFLTKYEKARIIGVRMQQLASGAKPCIDVSGLKTIEEIAHAELTQRALPFIIKRGLPSGISEYWKLEEFTIV